ncbi:MAG: hypothetical protein PVJ49_00640 [Acidobacteriota bacterium]|jgi:hypothetical protein
MQTSPLRRTALLLVLASSVLIAAGCVQRNVERISSEEAASLPPPPPPQPQAAPSQASTSEAASTRVTGTIQLGDGVTAPPGATLYLIVRVAGRETGAPLAVKQVPSPSFPYQFEVSERDAMIENTPLIGEMSITARLDQDGDAFSTSPGDLSGETQPVTAGETDVIVVLQEIAAGDGVQ